MHIKTEGEYCVLRLRWNEAYALKDMMDNAYCETGREHSVAMAITDGISREMEPRVMVKLNKNACRNCEQRIDLHRPMTIQGEQNQKVVFEELWQRFLVDCPYHANEAHSGRYTYEPPPPECEFLLEHIVEAQSVSVA